MTFGEKKLLNTKCVLILSTDLCETFLILRRFGRDIIINVRRSSCNIPHYSCHTLMKLEFSAQSFENYWNIKFHENSYNGSRIVSCVRRDGQTNKDDGANSRFSQCCEPAQKTLNFYELSQVSADNLLNCSTISSCFTVNYYLHHYATVSFLCALFL